MNNTEWTRRRGTGGSLQKTLRERGNFIHVSKELVEDQEIVIPAIHNDAGEVIVEPVIRTFLKVSPERGTTRRLNKFGIARRQFRALHRLASKVRAA